jgi:WD40 repeat protein
MSTANWNGLAVKRPTGWRLLVLAAVLGFATYRGQLGVWAEEPIAERTALTGHRDSVDSICFSSDGKTLASGSHDKSIRLWDVATGKNTATFRGLLSGSVDLVAFSPDGKTLASVARDSGVKLWEVASSRHTHTLKDPGASVDSLAFSPDSKTLATGSHDKTVKLWDVEMAKNTATFKGHSDYIFAVAFSPDGKLVASGSWDGTVKLWDVATGQNTATLPEDGCEVMSLAFSQDGLAVLAAWQPRKGKGDKAILERWETATGKRIARVEAAQQPTFLRSGAFSPDRKTFAAGFADEIQLWDVASGKRLATFVGNFDEARCVTFSPDGKTLAASFAKPLAVKLWDLPAAK